MHLRSLALFLVALLSITANAADPTYQPFVLASVGESGLEAQTKATREALQQAGFRIVGQHAPLESANVIVVTSPELQSIAAGSDKGGYAAGQRISVAERDGKTEVSFVNPVYIQYAYRTAEGMEEVYDKLSAVLGNTEAFGAKKKMTAKKLGKYHYMIGMQRFDDPSEVGHFDSYAEALAAIEYALAQAGDALSQVYRIDIPGKQQSVFGVAMKATSDEEIDIDEAHQLSIVDFDGHSKAAYFPYELLIDGTDVEALHMRFRMAVHFPDLSMMGAHGFTKLISSPKATEKAFEQLAANAKVPAESHWIDVRTAEEYAESNVSPAVNIPYDEIGARIGEVTQNKDALIYLYCRSGGRAGIAQATLVGEGYTHVLNLGGLQDAQARAAVLAGG